MILGGQSHDGEYMLMRYEKWAKLRHLYLGQWNKPYRVRLCGIGVQS